MDVDPELRRDGEPIPDAAPEEGRTRRTNLWLGAAVAVLSVAVIALSATLIVGSDSDNAGSTQPAVVEPAAAATLTAPGPAAVSDEVVRLLNERIAAVNRGDGVAAAALYARYAVLDEIEGEPYPSGTATYTFIGRDQIQKRLQELADSGLRLEATGEPIQLGDLVAEPTKFLQEGGTGYGEGILVFQIGREGTFTHQWMIGWVNSA